MENSTLIRWEILDELQKYPRQGTFRNLLQMFGLPRRLPEAAVKLGIGFECLKKRLQRSAAAVRAADCLNNMMEETRWHTGREYLAQRREEAVAALKRLEPELPYLLAAPRRYGSATPAVTPEQERAYRELVAATRREGGLL